ncbi:hypothetical protein ACJIZ3_006930 [Penstemon smallii]|uniref:FHA domain-containing protein n=1 Tax=Penstemon smallii TaxID=265156 RepID=A0ABD3S946_9LAMI
MARNTSVSPVRPRGSPRRRSPPRRERSPARHRSSNSEKISSRNRSPKRARSRSPVVHSSKKEKPSSHTKSPQHRSRSPVVHSSKKEKPSSHTKSPQHRKSPSPVSRSPVRQRTSSRPRSPKRVKSSSPPPLSPIKEKLPPRTRSPKRVKLRSSVSLSPDKGKLSIQTRSPRRDRSKSPKSHSLSPRSKRLKRAKAERNAEKPSEREHENNHDRNGDKATYKEKNSDRELLFEKKDRRPVRDAVDNGSSRSRHGRAASPSDHHHRGRRRSRSPLAAEDRDRDELQNSRDAQQRNGDNDSVAKMKAAEETLEAKEKHKPSFELSGKLAEETNRFRGVTLLFNEPPDARKPDIRWRLYVFKGGEVLNEPLYVHRQTCYLFGRERRVADIPTDHPSCSKQHAVLQYRQVEEENPDGTVSKRVRPYLMDLGSTNGTFINDNQMEPQRYYELFEKDTIKFGNSSREYVILHENSA